MDARNESIVIRSKSLENHTLCSSWSSHTMISHSFAYYINGPFLLVIVFVGFLGNILCLSAFSKSRRPRQINFYLIALSSWDLCLVIGSFFLYNLPYLMYGRVITEGPYVLAYPYIYALACAAHSGSIWAVIASGVDRYFALCHPIAHKIYTCAKRTASILAVLAVMVILYNLPRYYEIETSRCFDAFKSQWIPTVRGSELRSDLTYWFWYKVMGGLVFYSLVPFLTLTYLSIKVWRAVRNLTRDLPIDTSVTPTSGRKLKNTLRKVVSASSMALLVTAPISPARQMLRRHSSLASVAHESQYALNCMLLTVIVKFVICHSLPTALDVCEALMTAEQFNSPIMNNIVATSNFLVVCNSSVNFFIYCLYNRRFRQDLISGLGFLNKHAKSKNSISNARILNDEHIRTTSILKFHSPTLVISSERKFTGTTAL